MSDMIETFHAINDHKKLIRAKFGVDCPHCILNRPRANPSKLLPGQRCRVDGYRDPRPELTAADHQSVEATP